MEGTSEVVVLLGGVAGVDGGDKAEIVLVEVARRDVVFVLQPLVLATDASFESQPAYLLLHGEVESQVGLAVVKDVAAQGIALIISIDKGVKLMGPVLRLIMEFRSSLNLAVLAIGVSVVDVKVVSTSPLVKIAMTSEVQCWEVDILTLSDAVVEPAGQATVPVEFNLAPCSVEFVLIVGTHVATDVMLMRIHIGAVAVVAGMAYVLYLAHVKRHIHIKDRGIEPHPSREGVSVVEVVVEFAADVVVS